MCIDVYRYICIFGHICIHMYIYVHIHTYMYIYIYIHTYDRYSLIRCITAAVLQRRLRARDLTLQLIDELLVEAEVRGWRVKESKYGEVNHIDLVMDMET